MAYIWKWEGRKYMFIILLHFIVQCRERYRKKMSEKWDEGYIYNFSFYSAYIPSV